MDITEVKIQKIKPDPAQPRQKIDFEKVKEMAQSIKTEGVINPIEIDKTFTIITGEMRWRAAKLANLSTIPCKIISINPAERFRRQVIENIHHNTMTDWDTAKALKKLLDDLPIVPGTIGTHGGKPNQGYSDLGKIIGKGEAYIREKFNILDSSPYFQDAVKKGLSGSFIRVINRTPEEFKQTVEDKIVSGEINNRDAGLRIADALKRRPDKAEEILNVDYSEHESVADTVLALGKIAPQRSDLIKSSFENAEEFSRRVDSLVTWLKQNPPHTIGLIHAGEMLLGLRVLLETIDIWRKKSQQLTLNEK